MTNTTVSLTLNLNGKQAQSVLEQLGQSQKGTANELLRTNRMLEGVLRQQSQQTRIQSQQLQQLGRLYQQNARSVTQQTTQTNAALRTNQLLERVLEQQVRQSRSLSQQTRNQNRDYQLQINMLRQQVAAADRLRQQLEAAGRANREIGRGGTGGGLGAVSGISASVMAAYAITKSPLERARSFETKIFDANTSISGGYANMSHQQVVATNKQLSSYARDAVRQGHGTVDGIGDAAGILAASGAYQNVNDLKTPLLAIAKTAYANGATEQDVALLVQQIRQFGVMPDRTQFALDRATQSGFSGGFELRDMARFLPEVLPNAKSAGYSGEQGLNQVTTHMQLARKYTGIPSQAADNMRDLYSLFSQNHFALSIGKYIKTEKGDPLKKIGLKGNRIGFDMNTYLANQKLEGVDAVTATVKLMNRQLSKNKKFVDLQRQISIAEKNNDVSQALKLKQEASNIVAAGEFGKIFHNQQSLSALMSIIAGLNNGDFERISQNSWNGVGTVERVASEKNRIEPSKAHALEQEAILGTVKIYDTVKGTLGEFEGGLTKTMQANQALAASAIAAAGALSILAAGSITSKLLNGGTNSAGPILGGARAAGGRILTAGRGLVTNPYVGTALLGFGAGWEGGTAIRNEYMTHESGREFDHNLGGTLATIWQHMPDWAGGKEAREALESEMTNLSSLSEQQNQKVDQQIQQNGQLIAEIQGMRQQLGSLSDRPLNVNLGGSLLGSITANANTEEKRHGAVPAYLAAK